MQLQILRCSTAGLNKCSISCFQYMDAFRTYKQLRHEIAPSLVVSEVQIVLIVIVPHHSFKDSGVPSSLRSPASGFRFGELVLALR